MKKTLKYSLLFLIIFIGTNIYAQEKKFTIPSVDIKTLDGRAFNSANIENSGKPLLISFWATWCKPCIKELIAYDEYYDDWKDETGLKIVIISIDDSKSVDRVAPFINGRGWVFDAYLDENSMFKRAMNVINVPHTFLFDGDMHLVWQHTSYAEGDEEELYELLLKISKEE